MRIIGGKLKGKKLLFLKSSATRPLRDILGEQLVLKYATNKVHKLKGEVVDLQNPSSMPDPTQIA